eukprot:1611940-Alexandrium_andersonii.AAC.1
MATAPALEEAGIDEVPGCRQLVRSGDQPDLEAVTQGPAQCVRRRIHPGEVRHEGHPGARNDWRGLD